MAGLHSEQVRTCLGGAGTRSLRLGRNQGFGSPCGQTEKTENFTLLQLLWRTVINPIPLKCKKVVRLARHQSVKR